MNEQAAVETLKGWADRLGITWSLEHSPRTGAGISSGPLWDGQTMWAGAFGDNPDDWAHEIAHWVMSAPERRQHANYGIGADWQSGPGPRILDTPAAQDEEFKASMLGILMCELLGLDWYAHADFHSWIEHGQWGEQTFADNWHAYRDKVDDEVAAFAAFLEERGVTVTESATAPARSGPEAPDRVDEIAGGTVEGVEQRQGQQQLIFA